MNTTAKTTKHNNSLARTVMTLFMMLAMTLTASATDFITDVMVLGDDNKTSFYSQLSELTAQGWIDIDYDLNEACGAGTDYIHLLYKKQSSSGNTGVPITDFYIRTGDNPPGSLTYGGRTYYLVPYDGSDDFKDSEGDLNNNAGGDYIHLYYTKDALANNHGVTSITFNTTQSGAVGANGDSTGYNLNTGCGSQSEYVYMHIATTTGANVVTLSSGSGNVQLQNGHILTGTGGANTQVTITDGATVTFSGMNITTIANDNDHMWSGIGCLGNAVIILGGGTTNTVNGGFCSSGIYVPENKTLTIQGGGTLNATGGQNAAGIGSGSSQSSCGSISINGGTVNASGGYAAAGIGSGFNNSSCGSISINGGTVTATGGTRGAGIGGGEWYSSCGSISINGGTVTATGGENAAGIGSGFNNSSCGSISITQGVTRVTATKSLGCDNAIGAGNNSSCQSVTIGGVETGFITQSPFTTFPYTVAFNANGGTGTMANQVFMYNVEQNLTANAFTNVGRQFSGWATSANGPIAYNDGQSVSNLTATPSATVTLYAKWGNTVTLTQQIGEVLLQDGETLTGTGGQNTRVKIADGATVTFSGVNITAFADDFDHLWPGIECLGNAVIVLGEGTTNNVNGGQYGSGIYVPANKTLTIQGSGTLNATGGNSAAGIGSGPGYSSCCGNITINGGNVTANGGVRAAGIGSGYSSSCGNITISGGTVTATGGIYAAGIGNGYSQTSCGSISITQGVTRVTATKGLYSDNAIGVDDYYNSSCQSVTIGGVETGSIAQSPFITYPYTVAFNANGGTGTMANQVFMYNVAQNLAANAFTNVGRQVLGWATSANGPIVYNAGQSVSNLTATPSATVTLYAKWGNTVTLTQQIGEVLLQDGETLTGTGGQNTRVKIADGATVTFSGVNITAFADDFDHLWPGIECLGNAVIVLGEGTTNNVNGGQYGSGIYVPANKTLTIQGGGTLNATGGNSAAGIGSGPGYSSCCGNITINGGNVTANGGVRAAGIGSGYSSSCGNITISGGTVTATGGIYAAGIGNGYSQTSCGSISITQGVTRVTATKGLYSDNAIGVDDNNSSCQSVTIGGVETGSIAQSPFITYPYIVAFNANGGMGTMANQVFMYNVAQPLSASSFICTGYTRDGWATTLNGPKVYNDGQSVTNLTETSGATVTLYARWNALKAIAGYGESTTSGWNLIALPIEGSIAADAVGNIFSAAEYDLYRFNQNAEQEWENWKSHANNDDHYHFNLESGRGYLYASQAYTTLVFCGTPYSGNGQVTLHKTDGARLGGWNLIGNPFITSKTIGGKPFYRMNELGTEIIAAVNPTIAAMEGIFVVANTDGETVTFADPTRGRESEERIIINLCNNTAAVIDRAIVRLGEGETLPKMQIRDNSTKIYLSQGGKDYAIANAETTGEIPISFKPSENGTYIISVNPEGMEMDYLHLIDNLTGMDVNLLASPSYTFNAKTTDYASRFKLVFSANGNADSEEVPFAFLSNSNIIVNGDGIVQIIDMLGRIITNETSYYGVSTNGMVPGVYVLRLINGENVRTQKIVVR